ncbi:unnamed protein product, partial [Meganyctiphanes norvegica]
TGLNTYEGNVKVLLLDEGRWNVSVPLEQLYFCPLQVHIDKVRPIYEMFLLADVPPLTSWNLQVIHKLKLNCQGIQIPAFVNRNGINNFICPFTESGQPWVLELHTTSAGQARFLPFPGMPHNFANLAYAPSYDKNQFVNMMPFSAYPNFTPVPPLPFHSYGPSSKTFSPQMTGQGFGQMCGQGVGIPATYSSGISKYTKEIPYSMINSQNISNTSQSHDSRNKDYVMDKVSAGQVIKGNIVYIDEGPWKFYIQSNDQRRLSVVLKEHLKAFNFTKYLGEIKPSTSLIVKIHGIFYRALALEVKSDSKVPVYLMDTGHKDYVAISDAFTLPTEFNRYPLLVTRCKLAGLPKNHDDNVTAKFRKLAESSEPVKVNVIHPGVQHHLVEVNVFIKGHSILEMLIGYSNELLVNGDKLMISHICEKYGIVYLQDGKRAEQLEDMQIVLQDNAKTAELLDIKSLNVNDACIAYFPDDRNWYRAKILHIDMQTKQVQDNSKHTICVSYVDYGNNAHVPSRQIRKIVPVLQELMPAQAIPTIFTGLDMKTLPVKVVMEILKSSLLKVKIVKLHEKRLLYDSLATVAEVQVTDQSSGKKITEVIEFKLAQQQAKKTSCSVIPLERDGANPPKIQLYSDSLKLCRVSSAQTPKCFYVTLLENDALAQEVSSKLRNIIEKSTTSTLFVSGKLGQIVAAKSSDQCWHRALITRNYGDSVELFLIDNGREMKVAVSQLRVIPSDHGLWSVPTQAIKCSLDLDDITLENPRFKESFCNQAVGCVQNVHFKKFERNTWKVM